MAVKKIARAFIDVLDSEGKITNHEVENHITYEAEGEDDPVAAHFIPSVKREEVTSEQMAELRKESDNSLTAENTKLHTQIAKLLDDAEDEKIRTGKLLADANETISELATNLSALQARYSALMANGSKFHQALGSIFPKES